MDFDDRIHGCKCSGCDVFISPNELVMKALQNVYHVDCFKCAECDDKLEKGDEFILKDNKLYCSADFNIVDQKLELSDVFSSDEYDSMSTISAASPNGQDKLRNNSSSCKRPRTILTSQQREDFKAAFELTPKPCRKVREQLSNETGLSVRVVQVWFQNQRAKLKKIQKKTEGVGGSNPEKVKKINSGKISKKKRSKSASSIKSESSTSSGEFNLPNASSSSAQGFHSILDSYSNMNMQQLLSDGTSPNGKYSEDENNNNNNNNNTITINTNNNNNILMSGSDASNNSSINGGSPNVGFDQQNSPTEYSLRPLMNPFARMPSDLLLQTTGGNFNNDTVFSSTFPVVSTSSSSLSTSGDISSSASSQFQMMPHLMNSFV